MRNYFSCFCYLHTFISHNTQSLGTISQMEREGRGAKLSKSLAWNLRPSPCFKSKKIGPSPNKQKTHTNVFLTGEENRLSPSCRGPQWVEMHNEEKSLRDLRDGPQACRGRMFELTAVVLKKKPECPRQGLYSRL